jgi:hypothetical protein
MSTHSFRGQTRHRGGSNAVDRASVVAKGAIQSPGQLLEVHHPLRLVIQHGHCGRLIGERHAPILDRPLVRRGCPVSGDLSEAAAVTWGDQNG